MARYEVGTRVMVRVVPRRREPQSAVWLYENLTGEVVGSALVLAGPSDSCTLDSRRPYQALLEEYAVLLDIGFEISHIAGECLEELRVR